MKKLNHILLLIALFSGFAVMAQVAINTDGSTNNPSAILDVKSTAKGFLLPRMTTAERDAISNPAEGLMIFNMDLMALEVFGGSLWTNVRGEFVCGDLVPDVDGNIYNTILIGTQCWMKENLNIGTMIVGSSDQTDNATIEKYCYDNSAANCDTYGGLYQWNEMMGYATTEGVQGICPAGWHLPTDAEWITLEEEVESTTGVNWNTTGWRGTDAGGNLKETGTSHWASPNTGATNSSGFTGRPGGYRGTDGSFSSLANDTHFWSSSENGLDAWYRILYYGNAQVYRSSIIQAAGFSVRCLRD